MGVAATWTAANRTSAANDMMAVTGPLSFYAQQVYQSLSDADATEAAAFLAVTEPAAAREEFRADIERAGAYLREITAADSTSEVKADLATLITRSPSTQCLPGKPRQTAGTDCPWARRTCRRPRT